MMRQIWQGCALAIALIVGGSSAQAELSDRQVCTGQGNPSFDQRAKACTAIIDAPDASVTDRALAYGNRAVSYQNNQDREAAIREYDLSLALDSTSAVARRFSGNRYLMKNQYDLALAEFDEAIRLDPAIAAAHNGRGLCFLHTKEYDKAVAAFAEAMRLDPDYVPFLSNRALAYRNAGDLPRAFADYDQSIGRDPAFFTARYGRGVAYSNDKQYDKAIADFDKAIALRPAQAAVFLSRATAYRAKADYDRAIADYDEAHRLDPKNASIADGRLRTISSRGYARLKVGANATALADFNTVLVAQPKDAWALFGRGLAKWNTKDLAGGEADVEAANKSRGGIARLVSTEYGVTAHRDLTSKLAKARASENPMIFAVAEGAADACGSGCNAWIVADGGFDPGAEKRLRDFLRGLKGRKLPIFFNSTGGSMEQSYGIGKILRSNKMTVGVGRTMPDSCTTASLACRKSMETATPFKATLRTEGAICHSACAYALMGGAVRHVSTGALVGVHKPIRSTVDEARTGRSTEQVDAQSHARRRQYAKQMGVSVDVVELGDSTPFEHMRILTRDELARFKMETAR